MSVSAAVPFYFYPLFYMDFFWKGQRRTMGMIFNPAGPTTGTFEKIIKFYTRYVFLRCTNYTDDKQADEDCNARRRLEEWKGLIFREEHERLVRMADYIDEKMPKPSSNRDLVDVAELEPLVDGVTDAEEYRRKWKCERDAVPDSTMYEQ